MQFFKSTNLKMNPRYSTAQDDAGLNPTSKQAGIQQTSTPSSHSSLPIKL